MKILEGFRHDLVTQKKSIHENKFYTDESKSLNIFFK